MSNHNSRTLVGASKDVVNYQSPVSCIRCTFTDVRELQIRACSTLLRVVDAKIDSKLYTLQQLAFSRGSRFLRILAELSCRAIGY